MCKQRAIKQVVQDEKDASEGEPDIFIGIIQTDEGKDWTENVQVCKKPKVVIKFKLDTGAQVNVIPKHILEKNPNVKLTNICFKLINYNGNSIKNIGMCNLNCIFSNRKEISLDFIGFYCFK